MRRMDARVYMIAALVVLAAALGWYRMTHPARVPGERNEQLPAQSVPATPVRIRSMIDTTVQLLGAPKKFIARRTAVDSGRTVLESSIGVPAAFDELRLITALTDSLEGAGVTVAAAKNLKEKTTTIRFRDRDFTCIYRCILYRKELPH